MSELLRKTLFCNIRLLVVTKIIRKKIDEVLSERQHTLISPVLPLNSRSVKRKFQKEVLLLNGSHSQTDLSLTVSGDVNDN